MNDRTGLSIQVIPDGRAGIFQITPMGMIPIMVFSSIGEMDRFVALTNINWPKVRQEAEVQGMAEPPNRAIEVGTAIEYDTGMVHLAMVYHGEFVHMGPWYADWLDAFLTKLAEPDIAGRVLWGLRALRYEGKENEAIAEEAELFLRKRHDTAV